MHRFANGSIRKKALVGVAVQFPGMCKPPFEVGVARFNNKFVYEAALFDVLNRAAVSGYRRSVDRVFGSVPSLIRRLQQITIDDIMLGPRHAELSFGGVLR